MPAATAARPRARAGSRAGSRARPPGPGARRAPPSKASSATCQSAALQRSARGRSSTSRARSKPQPSTAVKAARAGARAGPRRRCGSRAGWPAPTSSPSAARTRSPAPGREGRKRTGGALAASAISAASPPEQLSETQPRPGSGPPHVQQLQRLEQRDRATRATPSRREQRVHGRVGAGERGGVARAPARRPRRSGRPSAPRPACRRASALRAAASKAATSSSPR